MFNWAIHLPQPSKDPANLRSHCHAIWSIRLRLSKPLWTNHPVEPVQASLTTMKKSVCSKIWGEKKKEEIKERKISWWGSEAINLGTTNGKKYSWGVVKLPRRRSEEEHCRQGGERPPFVAIYSDFLTDFENLFWWFDSHPGRATTSNWLVASPTTCPGACLPLLTSAIARNLPKAPDQSTQPPPAIIFRVDVRPA